MDIWRAVKVRYNFSLAATLKLLLISAAFGSSPQSNCGLIAPGTGFPVAPPKRAFLSPSSLNTVNSSRADFIQLALSRHVIIWSLDASFLKTTLFVCVIDQILDLAGFNYYSTRSENQQLELTQDENHPVVESNRLSN